MKHITILTLFTLHFSLFTLSASAAVPLRWTVETSRATPAQFEAYQGETLTFEAALQSYGKPLEAPLNYSLYWQTNGMGSAYWSAPCVATASSPSNVLFATWSPTNDVGARAYNCFIGKPGTIYHAAFQLRLRPSPGATPNELPLPQKVIDFAKVTVLNPPWSGGGGGGGVETNAVIDIIHKTVDGSARTLPPYLHYLEMDDTYPEASAEWYAQTDYSHGSCSAVREGNTLSRNYDWKFDFMPEFVVRTVAASATGAGTSGRFASIAVCNVGTNLTEADVTSGKWSKWYKALPGHAVDGINENGVVAEINVVGGNPQTSGWRNMCDIHPLGAVRWALDNGKSAEDAATNLAARITFPSGLTQNFHYMVADDRETWIVENGTASNVTEVAAKRVMTNFQILNDDYDGEGMERYALLRGGANITNAWWTLAYLPETSPIRYSDLGTNYESIWERWAEKPRETHRGESSGGQTWWQTVHTSVYDITNRTLRVAVQEQDDWYVFAVPSAGGGGGGVDTNAVIDIVHETVDPMIGAATDALDAAKRDKGDRVAWTFTGDTQGYENLWIGVEYNSEWGGSYDYSLYDGGKRINTTSYPTRQQEVFFYFLDDEESIRSITAKEDSIALESQLAEKVDAVPGKGLSSNDYTDDDKAEVAKVKDKSDEFTEWATSDHDVHVIWDYEGLGDGWYFVWSGGGLFCVSHDKDAIRLDYDGVTATRKRVLRTGDAATPQELTDAISTNNPAFVSAVRAISPSSIRTYDSVRQCWWSLEMVNGVPTWTVED